MSESLHQSTLRITLILLLAMCSSQAFAAKQYRVTAQFFHLGELIASPQFEVQEGEATAGSWTVEGSPRYKVIVKVNPATASQVYTSLQFVSGNINVQDNLLMDVGTLTEATMGKVKVLLMVENYEAPEPDA